MSQNTQRIMDMLDMLPEKEQEFACELMRKLVLAWDPDFTKVTPDEAAALREADAEFVRGEAVGMDAIDWN